MKPADITLALVRAAMERSKEWHEPNAEGYGYWVTAEDVVLIVHGFDGSLRTRAGWEAHRESREAAIANLGKDWDNVKYPGPTAGQVQVARKHLATLIEEGAVEMHKSGNANMYAWTTDAMRTCRNEVAALKERLVTLRDALHTALGGDDANVRVHTSLRSRMHQRGRYDGEVVVTLPEAQAQLLLKALTSTEQLVTTLEAREKQERSKVTPPSRNDEL